MTCIALYRADHAVFIASDGVVYDETGVVTGHAAKVIAAPHLGAAFGHSGPLEVSARFAAALSAGVPGAPVETFDELAEMFVPVCKAAEEAAFLAWRQQHGGAAAPWWLGRSAYVMAGWSEAEGRCMAFRTAGYPKANVDTAGETVAEPAVPWAVAEIGEIYVSSAPSQAAAAKCGIGVRAVGRSVPVFDYLARMVCAARLDGGEGDTPFAAGAFLQMTMIERLKVTSWIAHRWPDVIGERFDPRAGALLPRFPIEIP